MPVGICTSSTYCLLLLPSMKEIFNFKGWLIDEVVGFSTAPTDGKGILTHLLFVSLDPPKSKLCPRSFSLG